MLCTFKQFKAHILSTDGLYQFLGKFNRLLHRHYCIPGPVLEEEWRCRGLNISFGISVHEDVVEVNQSRTPRTLRYRNMTAVLRPDKNRLVATLREDGGVKNEVVWLKELDPDDAEKLHDFLVKARGKRR